MGYPPWANPRHWGVHATAAHASCCGEYGGGYSPRHLASTSARCADYPLGHSSVRYSLETLFSFAGNHSCRKERGYLLLAAYTAEMVLHQEKRC
ncbi:hypothetical protein DL89DRAFT_269290 [Linderina pennispora]|uniref:Uncharacterized protein n=1 Tax=Linderina pennispora TaxID=61395 RepID=A0A1Y1W1R9_9FUNG|nr:uncharacterized protein DL89DRAFT_269290 [Linderina pennispora]ORX67493.1 hypothetical protein DL89DRAFT_269290 [Linderina pennispora]